MLRLTTVVAIVASGVGWNAGGVRAEAFPAGTATRLYMAPEGTTLVAGLLGVPIGELEFGPVDPPASSTDVISQDSRDIAVEAEAGPLGCDTTTDQPVGVPDYDIDDCPRLELDVTHGRLLLEQATKYERDYLVDPDGDGPLVAGSPNPNDFVWRLPGGAIISQIGGGGDPADPNDPAGHTGYDLSGLADQINSALDGMSYVPDAGYRYTGTGSEETLVMALVPGDPALSNVYHDIEIRVLDVNTAASLEGPASATAQPEVELFIPEVAPPLSWPYAGSEWTVADPDNDEVVDDDSGETIPDGAGTKMLLVGYLDCGVPTITNETGFRLRGGTGFETDDADIEDMLTTFYGLTTAPQEVQDAVDLLFLALNEIAPGLTTMPLATSDPFVYNDIFAGIGTIDDVAYALSQVRFLSNAESDTCTLYTVVSDLGNNGLPLQYLGDPPAGVEVPFLGVPPIDIVETEITVGDLQPITANFDPATQAVLEGTTATATIVIDPATHPAFDLRWSAVDGTATAVDDFGGITEATITVPADTGSVQISTNAFADLIAEGNETFAFTLTVPTDPPDAVSDFKRPFGYEIVSTQSIQTVTILDADDTPAVITSFTGETVLEGDAGTTPMTFTIGLDKPADGIEQVDVLVSGAGTASDTDDHLSPTPAIVTFAPGSLTATVEVPVNGDVVEEPDETIVLTLADPSGVTVEDGKGAATGTIANDDGVLRASIDDVTVTEGDAGTTNATFTVSLDGPVVAAGGETLTATASDGTATVADDDYEPATGQVSFAQGESSATFTVLVNGDTVDENDETFTVTLSDPSAGLVVTDDEGIGTITDDDDPVAPDPSVITIADAFVSEGGASNEVVISMTNAVSAICQVEITSSDGTAVAPGDYAALAAQLVDLSGSATTAVPLTIVDDADMESGEDFSLSLALAAGSDPGCEIADGAAQAYIASSDGGADTPPFVTIDQAAGQDDPTFVSPIEFTIEFTEPVTGFTAGDVDLSAGTTDATLTPTLTGGPQTWTLSVAATGATATGTVVASIPADVASDGTMLNFASTSTDNEVTLLVDGEAPTVTIDQAAGQDDPTSTSPILFTVVFSEPVTGFATGDVTLGGTAGATTATVTDSGDATTFTVSVSGMTQDGTVIASVDASVATDAAGNANTASTSQDDTVTFDFDEGDLTSPTVTIDQAVGQADPTSASPILFTVVFSEPVTGFATGDVTLGGTAGATTAVVSGSGATYTVTVSGMTGAGTVVASIAADVAEDAASNPNEASTSDDNTVTYQPDQGAPLTLDVPDDIVTGSDPGQAGAVVTFAPASASGGVPPVTVTCDRTSGTFFPLGTTSVTCVATDGDSPDQERFVEAVVSASFTVTVLDDEPPVIDEPSDLVRAASSSAGAVVTFVTPSATDNAGVPTVVCSPTSGSLFPVGTSTVTCTATDAAGNSASASFTVTVTAPGSGGLPITGGDASGLSVLAALLLAVGVAARRLGRRAGSAIG